MLENDPEVRHRSVGPRPGASSVLPLWLLAAAFALVAACDMDGSPAVLGQAADASFYDAGPGDAHVFDAAEDDHDAALADAAIGPQDAALADAPAVDAHGPPPDAHTAPPDAHTAPPDAHPAPPDAHPAPPDAHIAPDANVPPPDAAPTGYQCHPLNLSATAACQASLTASVTACSLDPTTHIPSQTAWMDVDRADGTHGYLCASQWQDGGGFYFGDRQHLQSSSGVCCSSTVPAGAPAVTDPFFGTLHGPTHVKSQEMVVRTGGLLRENPFTVVVSSTAAAAVYYQRLALWRSYAGDGQAHPGPDGTGSYYFPSPVSVMYVVIRTSNGAPMILLAPEVSMDPDFETPLGHPTMGACAAGGGAPLAFIGGTLDGTVLTNASGRFGHESTVTAETLANTADLFNCYGVHVTGTQFSL